MQQLMLHTEKRITSIAPHEFQTSQSMKKWSMHFYTKKQHTPIEVSILNSCGIFSLPQDMCFVNKKGVQATWAYTPKNTRLCLVAKQIPILVAVVWKKSLYFCLNKNTYYNYKILNWNLFGSFSLPQNLVFVHIFSKNSCKIRKTMLYC